ncbi:hypothetical protein DN752_01615 [Echinicola strongylocentroti]|uniref:Uncharacterized protein n=1 Tax=Echinicola strongylocentroti TaxID=1795355 RepID=A0A2Z4ID30_9BACT|nr:hypothetical protein [Echinicola strongylocentroti]AWW28931.1 hypothetical protein DN752_01615 [Echinicola strongylocentroti]
MVSLKSSHIYIESDMVETVFCDENYAYAVYKIESSLLLLTPVSNQWFARMHKNPTPFLLKNRNLKGDKTLPIREILIDNNLDTTDRDLAFELIKKTSLLKVKL